MIFASGGARILHDAHSKPRSFRLGHAWIVCPVSRVRVANSESKAHSNLLQVGGCRACPHQMELRCGTRELLLSDLFGESLELLFGVRGEASDEESWILGISTHAVFENLFASLVANRPDDACPVFFRKGLAVR